LRNISESFIEMYQHLEKIKSKKKYLISIIIPVYNEENTILSVLKSLPNNNNIEIVVIDDFSKDNSLKEINRAQKIQNINLIKHTKNQGYGQAILTGIKNSNGKILVTMDADGQHLAKDIYNLVKPILNGEAEYTIGSRYLGSFHYKLPLSTRFGELLVEKLLLILFGQKVENNQGGFRAFDQKIIKIFDNIQYLNFAFTTELIIRARLYGYRIKECPISLMDRVFGKSRIKLKKLAINIFFCFFRYSLVKIKMIVFKNKQIKFKKKKLIFKEH